MRNISILSKNAKKSAPAAGRGLRRRLRRAAGASAPDPVYTRAMPRDLSRSQFFLSPISQSRPRIRYRAAKLIAGMGQATKLAPPPAA